MLERFWDFSVNGLMVLFMPMLCSYFTITSNNFINVSIRDATGLEAISNTLLSPTHYILAGREATQLPDGSWEFVQRFDYTHNFWIKTAGSIAALPPSIILGSLVKGLSLFNDSSRKRYFSLNSLNFTSHIEKYREMGMEVGLNPEIFLSEGHLRRPNDEKNLSHEKEAMRDIIALLNEAQITWWVDCGTCLGAYRYGGVIPWDEDIDIAVLLPDFQNVLSVLAKLDSKKYIVQDWSTRDHPNCFFKVFVRETSTAVDIYHFEILPESKHLQYVLALESHMFFPEWIKIRERRFTEPVSFNTVFPLKKALFDGIEVFIPNDPKKYLQRCYGENLDPVKVYNSTTDRYEKDLTHPYWQKAYVH